MTPSPADAPGAVIHFRPAEATLRLEPGESLLDGARRGAIPLASSCGGSGTCLSCLIRIVDGPAPEPSAADRRLLSAKLLADGWRRACQIWPREGCAVQVPPRSAAAQTVRALAGNDVRLVPDPTVRTWRIRLAGQPDDPASSLDDRLIAAINRHGAARCQAVDADALRAAAAFAGREPVRLLAALRRGELVQVLPADRRALALAVDLGTTSIGAFLLDLRRGRTAPLCQAGITNPQQSLGGDIITRLNRAVHDARQLRQLQRLAIEGINRLATTLCAQAEAAVTDICDVVVAGNTVMAHFLLALPVAGLAHAPFSPLLRGAADLEARDLGLAAAPAASVHLFPAIAGFIGGDHVAALLALETRELQGITLLLDIGTNTEISLLRGEEILSVSCPSGPALEGGEITWGMQAARGAIERVTLREDGEPRLQVIDGAPPEGICGSAVLDIVAELLRAGLINHRGRLQPGPERVRDNDHTREFVLVAEAERDAPAIVFTQGDVRAVQLAKAAIRSGIDMLLQAAGLDEAQLDQVIVAGAFGSYIDLDSAIAIGMLPGLPRERFAQIGDAAGLGTRLAALSHPHRAQAARIAQRARYISMAGSAAFQRQFVSRINFRQPAAAGGGGGR
ncbi:MAG: DUF4445 domain-containing protein [Gammaproteobacteria bacterium]|nr:MAG: DUF4445 domain-containing protein [Gammaproteobacteria bacterium]